MTKHVRFTPNQTWGADLNGILISDSQGILWSIVQGKAEQVKFPDQPEPSGKSLLTEHD